MALLNRQRVPVRCPVLCVLGARHPLRPAEAGYGFELARGTLELELGFQGGGTSAPLHAGPDAKLWVRGLELSATYRYPLWRFFEPYARFGAGVDWARLSLNDDALSQRVSVLSGSAMLGFNVPLVASKDELGRRTRVALEVGLGYAQRQAADFNALAPGPPDKARAGGDAMKLHRWDDLKREKLSPQKLQAIERRAERKALLLTLRELRQMSGKTQIVRVGDGRDQRVPSAAAETKAGHQVRPVVLDHIGLEIDADGRDAQLIDVADGLPDVWLAQQRLDILARHPHAKVLALEGSEHACSSVVSLDALLRLPHLGIEGIGVGIHDDDHSARE
jgi:hypothetical protein